MHDYILTVHVVMNVCVHVYLCVCCVCVNVRSIGFNSSYPSIGTIVCV